MLSMADSDPDMIQKKIIDPVWGEIHEVYTHGNLASRNASLAGTGFSEEYHDGILVIKNTYKNYEMSTHKRWDENGKLTDDEWYVTRSDISNALTLGFVVFLAIALFAKVYWKKRQHLTNRCTGADHGLS